MSKNFSKKVFSMCRISPTTHRRLLYEVSRLKLAEDILAVMKESGITVEIIASKMKMKKSEVSEWIWTKDLKLSEICRLLSMVNATFYPLIRDKYL